MGKHPGIGATTASALVFSILLVSNFALFFAAQDRARLYSQSNGEDSLGDNAIAMIGAGVTNFLEKEQTFLESVVLPCDGANALISGEVAVFADVQRSSDLTVRTSATMTNEGFAIDNLSMVAPFNGLIPGDLDFAIRVIISGADTAAGITYHRNETHFVHLPARIQAAEADCLSAVRDASVAVSAAVAPNCSAAAIAPMLDEAIHGGTSKASRDGFTLGFEFEVLRPTPCSVSLMISVDQLGIQGPGGLFNLRMREEASVSFEQ
jgi:hypothetical protein